MRLVSAQNEVDGKWPPFVTQCTGTQAPHYTTTTLATRTSPALKEGRLGPRKDARAHLMRLALLALALSGGLAAAAPALVGQAPADGATGVHPLASLTLTFSEDVVPESAALLSLRRAGSRRPISVVAAQSNFVSANGSVVTVVFPTRQVLTGRVGVEVEPGAFKARSNGASFAGIGEGAWTFSFDGERLS